MILISSYLFSYGCNIVLSLKFHFAGELRGFIYCVCDFGFVFRVLKG